MSPVLDVHVVGRSGGMVRKPGRAEQLLEEESDWGRAWKGPRGRIPFGVLRTRLLLDRRGEGAGETL